MSASAGFGKSVALRHFLEIEPTPHAVFALQEEHASLAGFVRGLCQSVSHAAPHLLKSINLAIQKSADAKIPGENLADWLVSNLCDSPALLIAIDDAHVADGEPQVWKFLSRVVGNRKGGHRWLLTSRTVPDLPLGSWLVDGIANAGIDEFDLRLNIEEARELAVASGVAIREDILASLISMTGGWPMSVAIALRSSVGGELVKRFEDQSRTALYDFAVAELFASLGASEKSMLSLASSMAIVEMRLLVVAGYPQAPVFFKHLADTTAFAEDAGAGAYRLHDLFRARARAVSESNQAEESAQFAKIANSLRLAGRPTEALAMYARCGGGATVEIMSILNDQGVKMVDGGESDLVLSVIGQLPPAVRREIPCVQVLRAMTASLSGGFEEAERLYRKAIGGDDRTMRIVAATRLAHLLGNIGRPGAADVLADYADLPTNEVLTCDALSTFAVALAASNPKRATAVMSRVLLAARDLDDDEFTVYALHRAGFVAFYAGARENSERWSLDAAKLAAAAGLFGMVARSYSVLYFLAATQGGDSALALWYAGKMAEAAERAGEPALRLTGLACQLGLEAERGSEGGMENIEEQLRTLREVRGYREQYDVRAARALRSIWNSDFVAASLTLIGVVEDSLDTWSRMQWIGLRALVLACERRLDEADEMLATLASLFRHAPKPGNAVEIRAFVVARVYAAVGYCLIGRRSTAERIIPADSRVDFPPERMLLACARSFVSPKSEREFKGALSALRTGSLGGYARAIEVFRTVLDRNEQSADAAVSLTPTERTILLLLADGDSDAQIAAKAGRAQTTVRTHLTSLYAKLGVSGRTKAVLAARKAGLI